MDLLVQMKNYTNTVGNFMKSICRYRHSGYFSFYDQNNFKHYYSCVRGPHQKIPLDSILVVGVAGLEVMIDGELGIRNLHFIFRELFPSSKYLISKKRIILLRMLKK